MAKEIGMFTLKHTAHFLNVHPNTIRNWLRAGKIIGRKQLVSNYWYFSLNEINRLRKGRFMSELSLEEAWDLWKKY